MAIKECNDCQGNGTYFDRRCQRKECSHLGSKNADGEHEPIMACPERACSCKAGAKARAALRKIVLKQELRFGVELVSWSKMKEMVTEKKEKEEKEEVTSTPHPICDIDEKH